MTDRCARSSPRGFSIFELLVILALITLIAAWSVPALIPTIQSRSLTAAADQFEQDMGRARQVAMAEDVVVDVEFIRVVRNGERDPKFVGYAFWKWLSDGERYPLGKTEWLADGFVFGESHSTLLRDGASERETRVFSELEQTGEVVRFSIFPNGETSLPSRSDQDNWHVTIYRDSNRQALPDNFVAFRINQTNAHVISYQP